MLPPVAREKTNLHRVVAAIIFAFAFPPVGLAVFSVASDMPSSLEQGPAVLAALPAMLVMSLYIGWLFVVPACIIWAFLHQFDQHHVWAAALVGLVAGFAFAWLPVSFGDDCMQAMAIFGVGALTGVLTGLGVWWIAYSRQGSLSSPIITRPPLAL
jgi:uncharacterized membrane protein YfbV (UPF0208 family)